MTTFRSNSPKSVTKTDAKHCKVQNRFVSEAFSPSRRFSALRRLFHENSSDKLPSGSAYSNSPDLTLTDKVETWGRMEFPRDSLEMTWNSKSFRNGLVSFFSFILILFVLFSLVFFYCVTSTICSFINLLVKVTIIY